MSVGGDKAGGAAPVAGAPVEDSRWEIERLRELVDVAQSAIGTLRGRCDEAAAAIGALRDRCDEAEESRAHLARLAVASARLHESDVETESLHNLQDVLVNLIGTEQIAVWRLVPDGRTFELRASQGIDAGPWLKVAVDHGLLGQAMASGDVALAEPVVDGRPSVCIPLLIGSRVVGMVAVFRLLPHRGRLGPRDHDVFRLVSEQAGFALLCSGQAWGPSRRAADG